MIDPNGIGELINIGNISSGILVASVCAVMTTVLALVRTIFKRCRANWKLKSILPNRRFIFTFNPEGKRRKIVSFNSDGTIGEGQNDNENRWKVQRGCLEVFGADKQLYSRFRYDSLSGRLIHTNDPKTRSIRNQFFEIMGARVDPPNPLCGIYETFHLSTARNGEIITSVVEITTDDTDHLVVSVESFGYKYIGDVIADGRSVTFRLSGNGHSEQPTMVFSEPLSREFDILLGVYAAVTETFVPVCGKLLAHKVGTRPSCRRIEQERCDGRILNFLSSPQNPILAPKVEPPLLGELPLP